MASTKPFDALPLQLGAVACGAFSGYFAAEDGVVTDIVLNGDKWGFNADCRYVKSHAIVILSETHWLWKPLADALADAYRNEIADTDSEYDPEEHRHGKFETTGRR